MDNPPVPSDANIAAQFNAKPITPAQILCLAKGFSRIFWGVFLMIGLFLCQAGLEVFHGIRIPAYVFGAGLICWGLWLLLSASPARQHWQSRTRMALALACLVVYFAPFITWWQTMPYENVFMINVLGLLLAGMGVLLMVNLLAAETFGLFEIRGSRIEAQIFAFGVVIMMLAPFMIGLLFALVASIHYDSLFAEEIWMTINRIPVWLYVATTLPCSLTMVASWKAKNVCYQRLWNSGDKTDPPTPERFGGQAPDDGPENTTGKANIEHPTSNVQLRMEADTTEQNQASS